MPRIERRLQPRIRTNLRAACSDGGSFVVHDLSSGGFFATSDRPRWPGSLVQIAVALPGLPRSTAPIHATCRINQLVGASHGFAMSLRFLLLSEQATMAIEEAVRDCGSRPAPPSP